MSVNVQELYRQTVLPLPEPTRSELFALIAHDLAPPQKTNGLSQKNKRKGDIPKFFGSWQDGTPDDSNNENIDADLARAYASDLERA